MGIDERLDRLVERHEALAESVESLFRLHLEQDKRFEEYDKRAQEEFARQKKVFGEIALRFRDTRETIDALARIAGVPQDRLDNHEERLDGLEGPSAA